MAVPVAFADGACSENGQDNARAAGVLWGDDDEKNVSEVVPEDLPQTNG